MRFAIDETIAFAEEPQTPYTVKAISRRFAILTRPMTTKDAKDFEYDDPIDGHVVYTIVDSQTMKRGPNNLVFNAYNYTKQEDIEECLRDLDAGQIELSQRRSVPVLLADDDGA